MCLSSGDIHCLHRLSPISLNPFGIQRSRGKKWLVFFFSFFFSYVAWEYSQASGKCERTLQICCFFLFHLCSILFIFCVYYIKCVCVPGKTMTQRSLQPIVAKGRGLEKISHSYIDIYIHIYICTVCRSLRWQEEIGQVTSKWVSSDDTS